MTTTEPPPSSGLLSAPVEIIVRILQCCHSSRDLVALVSTCRHVYIAWRGNIAAAMWPFWLREIPHFEDAIMAARMTALVAEAERRGELPPTRISPGQPELQRYPPSLAEVTAAYQLYGLSRSIASCFCSQHLTFPECRECGPEGDCHPERDWWTLTGDHWSELAMRGPEEHHSRMPEWRARVSHAVFRLLILGAALAGTYQEPLFRAREHPDPEIQALAQGTPPVAPGDEGGTSPAFTQKQLDYLLQFAVCDLDATLEAQDAVFGPMADWLLESILSDEPARQAMALRWEERRGRAEYCLCDYAWHNSCALDLLADGRGTHSDAHLVVWEVMQIFWLVSRVRPGSSHVILDRDTPCPASSRGVDAGRNRWGPLEAESAVAVFFGVFRAEETLLKPACSLGPPRTSWGSESVELHLKACWAVPGAKEHGDGELPSEASSVMRLLARLFTDSGRPNHFEDGAISPVPPLEFKFFEYFVRRHLGLCFEETFFGEDEFVAFDQFEAMGVIFSHDDDEDRRAMGTHLKEGTDFIDGTEILIKYPPPVERFYKRQRL